MISHFVHFFWHFIHWKESEVVPIGHCSTQRLLGSRTYPGLHNVQSEVESQILQLMTHWGRHFISVLELMEFVGHSVVQAPDLVRKIS